MLEPMRLPHYVPGQVFRVLQSCLGEMSARPIHVAECHATLLLPVRSICCHSLQFPDVVNGKLVCGQDVMNPANGLRLERYYVRALIHIEHRPDRAEPGGVGQSDDFNVASLQHRAVICRTPLLDRHPGCARAAVKAARGQIESEPAKGPFARIQIASRNADVIEIDGKWLRQAGAPIIGAPLVESAYSAAAAA